MDICLQLEMTVEDIKRPVKEEMALFEKKFKSAMKSDVALLDKIGFENIVLKQDIFGKDRMIKAEIN